MKYTDVANDSAVHYSYSHEENRINLKTSFRVQSSLSIFAPKLSS